LAADQGDANAQLALGARYHLGQGVPKDYVEAYKWLNLSAAQGTKNAAEIREIIAEDLTPEQTAEAQKLSREWKSTVKE